MDRRVPSALLWGLVGACCFLVGHQSWLLLGGQFRGAGPVLATTLLVGAVVTIGAYVGEEWFLRQGR